MKDLSDYQYYKGEAMRYLGLYEKLQAENKKLRECVEFYAEGTFIDPISDMSDDDELIDNEAWKSGKRARQCLKELEGGE